MSGAGPIGIVVGLRSELAALGRWRDDPRVLTAVSGARPGKAEDEARRLIAAGARALASFGIAGGLDPALRPGDALLGAAVLDGAARRPLAAPPGFDAAPPALLLGSDAPLTGVAAKAAARRSGAAAVDMETHRVARAAAAAGLPAAALRAIADPAGRALPKLAEDAVDEHGAPRVGRVLAGLVRRPGALPALLALKRDSDAAHATLARLADGFVEALLDLRV